MIYAVLLAYVLFLLGISFRLGKYDANADFFVGNRHSPWWAVALGMLGASVSGVTLISVPGAVQYTQFTYMQMVLGFIPGYLFIALVLLPLYYRNNLTSIYELLSLRFGPIGGKTASFFFVVGKLLSSAVKFYMAVFILHKLLFETIGVSFFLVAITALLIVWIYTYKSGIRTIVWTDFIQTIFLVISLFVLLKVVIDLFGEGFMGAFEAVAQSTLSTTFVFDDWISKQNFFKQFLSGAFVVIVMTGLDQDLMQKNLSCKSLSESRKNILLGSVLFIPLNLILLSLGALIILFYSQNGIQISVDGDLLLSDFVLKNGQWAMMFFSIGIMASAFSSMDSAMTSITTSFSVDFLGAGNVTKFKRIMIHFAVAGLFLFLMCMVRWVKSDHALDMIYTLVSYLYGPLLGLFAFAMATKRKVRPRAIPLASVLGPLLSYIIALFLKKLDYVMGYELLLLNGAIVFLVLFLNSKRSDSNFN